MTPAQRRREMEEEVCRHRAQKLMRQAVGREVRLHKIAHSHYPHGILGQYASSGCVWSPFALAPVCMYTWRVRAGTLTHSLSHSYTHLAPSCGDCMTDSP